MHSRTIAVIRNRNNFPQPLELILAVTLSRAWHRPQWELAPGMSNKHGVAIFLMR